MSGSDDERALTPSVRVHTDGDHYKPLTREDVSDLAGLPRRFDQFVERTETAFELLTERIVKPLLAIQESIADLVLRATHLEERVTATERAQVDHEQRLAALEAIRSPKPRARRKSTTRKKARR